MNNTENIMKFKTIVSFIFIIVVPNLVSIIQEPCQNSEEFVEALSSCLFKI